MDTNNTSDPTNQAAQALQLYENGEISFAKAAQLSALSTRDFLAYLQPFKIELASPDDTTEHETQELSLWLTLQQDLIDGENSGSAGQLDMNSIKKKARAKAGLLENA